MATAEAAAAKPPRATRKAAFGSVQRGAGATRAQAPQLAYVLHRHDWSESSLIVELFTRAQGRVVVVAKGAKKPTSNFRAVLLPFAPLHALLGAAPGDEQGELQTLRSAEWAGGAPLLAGAQLLSAFYLNELLLKLLARQDPHPVLFDGYADTLAALAGGDAGAAAATPAEGDARAARAEACALRAFELRLLRELGWLPDLASETLAARPLDAARGYALQPEAGLTPSERGLPAAAWTAIEAALAHGSGAALRAACAAQASALRAPLRGLLHYHLGHSKLRTRDVLLGVQRLADSR